MNEERDQLTQEEKGKKEKDRIIAAGMLITLCLAITIVLSICTLCFADPTLYKTGIFGVIVMYVICEGEVICLFLIALRELREKNRL